MYKHNEQFWRNLDKLIQNSSIVIDRPKGSRHPRFSDFIYPIDYGYLEDTSAVDGGGVDIWIGSQPDRQLDAIMITVDLMKNDTEIKLLFGCTAEEKACIYRVHNDKDFMKGILINRYE